MRTRTPGRIVRSTPAAASGRSRCTVKRRRTGRVATVARLGDEHAQPVDAVAQPVGPRQRGRPARTRPSDHRLGDGAPVEPGSQDPLAPRELRAGRAGDDVDLQRRRVAAGEAHAGERRARRTTKNDRTLRRSDLAAGSGDDHEVVASGAQAVAAPKLADESPARDAQARGHVAIVELYARLRAGVAGDDDPHRVVLDERIRARSDDEPGRGRGRLRLARREEDDDDDREKCTFHAPDRTRRPGVDLPSIGCSVRRCRASVPVS